MKKNVTNDYTPDSSRTKEQMEDHVFNKMMFWLLGTLVAEIIMILCNRFFVHARTNEIDIMVAMNQVMMGLPIVGVVLFVVFLFWGVKARKAGDRWEGCRQMVVSAVFLAIGIGAFLMRHFGTVGAPVVLAAIPSLGVLALIFYLFQREFFCCGVVCGLAILTLWVFRVASVGRTYYLVQTLTMVLAAIGVGCFTYFRKKDGVMNINGTDRHVLQPGAAYWAYFATVVIAVLLMLAPLVLGAAVAYYGIWILIAWLFILAVYFTSKLM